MSANNAYRIRLRGFWAASAVGRTRFARRFGRPRTLDPDESAWIVGLNPPTPVVVSVNGIPIGETSKTRPFAFEIPFPLQPRNEVAIELGRRMCLLFLPDADGHRPTGGAAGKLPNDPNFRDVLHFHEFFNGDTGEGLGASHQTGWTGLVAKLLDQHAVSKREKG